MRLLHRKTTRDGLRHTGGHQIGVQLNAIDAQVGAKIQPAIEDIDLGRHRGGTKFLDAVCDPITVFIAQCDKSAVRTDLADHLEGLAKRTHGVDITIIAHGDMPGTPEFRVEDSRAEAVG
jgi:hypothetical protein